MSSIKIFVRSAVKIKYTVEILAARELYMIMYVKWWFGAAAVRLVEKVSIAAAK